MASKAGTGGAGSKPKYGPTKQSGGRVVVIPGTKRVRPVRKKMVGTMTKTVTPAKATSVPGGGSAGSSSPRPSSSPPKKDKEDRGRRTRTRPNEPRGKAGGRDKNPPGVKRGK